MISQYIKNAADNLVTIEQLVDMWRIAHISLRCKGAGHMAKDHALGGRIRGALGNALKEGASEGAIERQKCDWDAPCALDIFFNCQGKITSRLEVPKPWALNCFVDNGDLMVNVCIFGIAGDWAGEVADALVRGLKNGCGL